MLHVFCTNIKLVYVIFCVFDDANLTINDTDVYTHQLEQFFSRKNKQVCDQLVSISNFLAL